MEPSGSGDWSGREDLNLRPQRPERCALTKLRYSPRPRYDRGTFPGVATDGELGRARSRHLGHDEALGRGGRGTKAPGRAGVASEALLAGAGAVHLRLQPLLTPISRQVVGPN